MYCDTVEYLTCEFGFPIPLSLKGAGKPVFPPEFFDPGSEHRSTPTLATQKPVTIQGSTDPFLAQPSTNSVNPTTHTLSWCNQAQTLLSSSPLLIHRKVDQEFRPRITSFNSLLYNKKASLASPELEPMRQAGKTEKGVFIVDTPAPPQYEFDASSYFISISAGKPVSLLSEFVAEISTEKTLWSTSSRLEDNSATKEPSKIVKEQVPTRYHWYFNMFKKSKARCLPPRHKYYFQFEFMPSAQPQVSRVIQSNLPKEIIP